MKNILQFVIDRQFPLEGSIVFNNGVRQGAFFSQSAANHRADRMLLEKQITQEEHRGLCRAIAESQLPRTRQGKTFYASLLLAA